MPTHNHTFNIFCLLLTAILTTACAHIPSPITQPTKTAPPKPVAQEKLQVLEFTYHHFVKDEADVVTGATRAIDKLEYDLKYLQDHDYNCVTHQQVIDYHDKGIPLPPKPYAIRIDDGYLSNYTLAFPLLKKYNAKAAICIIGVSVGVHENIIPHFSWEQAREMVDSGHVSIQNHTYNLHKIDQSGVGRFEGEPLEDYKTRIREDISKLNDLIYQNVGQKPYLFAYPNGVANDTAEQVVKDLGFTFTTARPDILSTERDYDKYNLIRLDFFSWTKIEDLIKTAQ